MPDVPTSKRRLSRLTQVSVAGASVVAGLVTGVALSHAGSSSATSTANDTSVNSQTANNQTSAIQPASTPVFSSTGGASVTSGGS